MVKAQLYKGLKCGTSITAVLILFKVWNCCAQFLLHGKFLLAVFISSENERSVHMKKKKKNTTNKSASLQNTCNLLPNPPDWLAHDEVTLHGFTDTEEVPQPITNSM
jgi:hypothetical protein